MAAVLDSQVALARNVPLGKQGIQRLPSMAGCTPPWAALLGICTGGSFPL